MPAKSDAPLFDQLKLHDRIDQYDGDIRDFNSIKSVIEKTKPEAIIHYAEQPSAPYSMAGRESATFTQNNNVIGNLNLLFAIE